jgi:hypothetical protein
MSVSYPTNDLLKKEFGFLFGKDIIVDIIVELSTLGVFHNDEDIIGGIEYFIEFDNIFVIDEF